MNIRKCPKCNRDVIHKNERVWLRQTKLNRPCKWCTSNNTSKIVKEKREKAWKSIVGYWPIKYRTFVRIRNHWKSISKQEKLYIHSKTPLQKRYYWEHLRIKNQTTVHKKCREKKCREVMAIKYGGNNHWMKRPEVIAKVRKTCEKYRGDGHWFRRKQINLF